MTLVEPIEEEEARQPNPRSIYLLQLRNGYTLGANQRSGEFYGELAVCTDREQIGRGVEINHGHWNLQECKLGMLLRLRAIIAISH
jgi:hypothetical protein